MAAELALSLLVGVGLAAACGFRVFVPPLVISLAARSGHLTLGGGFEWMSGDLALGVFGVATLLELLAYFLPGVDNLLDAVATPAAVVAGAVVASACVVDTAPALAWALALVAGGGVAGTTQAVTVTARLGSTATTGGIGNPVVSTLEAIGSLLLSLLAVLLPLALLAALGLLAYAAARPRAAAAR